MIDGRIHFATKTSRRTGIANLAPNATPNRRWHAGWS